MAASLIEVRNVCMRFGNFVAVDDLSFQVAEGEIVALLGRTGAGKSTVLNLVMGTTRPHSGTISVAGVDPYRDFRALRGRIAVSFQNDRLLPWRTAVENAELGLIILGVAKSQARQRAMDWLARVKLTGAEHRYVHELSGGMRQRVSLARALAVEPSIIFLDESFSQLDHATARTLRADFSRIAAELQTTCLFVTHRIEDAIEIADRALVLTQSARIGLVEEIGPDRRADPVQVAAMHDRIADILGGTDDPHEAAAAEPSEVAP